MHYKEKKSVLQTWVFFVVIFNFCTQRKRVKSLKTGIAVKQNSSQRCLPVARISRPEQDFVGLFSVSAGVGARESTLEDIGILGVVVLPYGMLVDEVFAGLLDELFGLRWILFLRRWTPVSVSTVQGHPKTLFCKISHRRSRCRLDLSITSKGRVFISRWPFLSCTIFEVHCNKFPTIF